MKAAAIVVRRVRGRVHILCFRHPLAGIQIVKGTIGGGERPIRAALRELHEESGLRARRGRSLGVLRHPKGPVWHLVLCEARAPRTGFEHFCADDGGHVFAFFWHPLAAVPNADWHPAFGRALRAARKHIARRARAAMT